MAWFSWSGPDDTQEVPPTATVHMDNSAAAFEPTGPSWPAKKQALLRLARQALLTESLRPAEMRDQRLIDFALDVRAVLMPPKPVAEPSVPVVPGRTP